MNVLAIIPARGGSKGVLRKNIRPCGGKPLLVWSVETALASRFISESGMVVVSSDDAEILECARLAGAIGQERPARLATDEAATDHVLRYVMLNLEFRPDLVVTLQPTVPIRRPGLIDDCIQRLLDTDADSLFTGRCEPYCWWRVDARGWADDAKWVSNNPFRKRRQDMHGNELHWHEDGSVYVTRPPLLVSYDDRGAYPPRRIGGRVQIFPNEETVDIDTEAQFAAASAMLYARAEAAA